MEVALREKGRLTLPAKIREAMALREGDTLKVSLEGGAIVLRPGRAVTVDAMKGVLGRGRVELQDVEDSLGTDVP
ncbi:MAG: AbrB/MazE/SpoVT family DNA-binding domain-containing protein [Nitrososphaerota archaeon]|nr:AbrB/MazE/SpoVT family DNA-binding domain-containing protein [Nitrososphaerota archaeon]